LRVAGLLQRRERKRRSKLNAQPSAGARQRTPRERDSGSVGRR
jgi:hypothetical protein